MHGVENVLPLDADGERHLLGLLAQLNINIIDISQTVMEDFFTMIMLTDTSGAAAGFDGIADALSRKGEEMQLSIRVQREDIFNAMHTI